MYATITEDGFTFHDTQVADSFPVVDNPPEVEDGFVAALSRYEKIGDEVHAIYTIEHLPITSKSQVDVLAEAVAKRILQQ